MPFEPGLDILVGVLELMLGNYHAPPMPVRAYI
jgi:hypothetical protein